MSLIIVYILHMDKNTWRFVDKTKPCMANIVPAGEKFLTNLVVLPDKHLFKQSIQQKQLQINLSTNWNKIFKKFLSQMFQSNSKIKTDFLKMILVEKFKYLFQKRATLISDENPVGQNIFK